MPTDPALALALCVRHADATRHAASTMRGTALLRSTLRNSIWFALAVAPRVGTADARRARRT